MSQPQLVLVDWIDSCSPSRKWQQIDSMKGYHPAECQSVGWLMEKHRDYIVLAASKCGPWDNDEAGHWTAIPRGCVKKIRRLK